MARRTFSTLAAKLYPITAADSVTRPEDIQGTIGVGMKSYGSDFYQFGGLTTDNKGRVVVQFCQPRVTEEFKTICGAGVMVRDFTMRRYELPVRAFIRAARLEISRVERETQRKAGLQERYNIPSVPAAKSAPVYRDGLLALAKELERRKSCVRTGCTSVEM